jgi:hypothetical protein
VTALSNLASFIGVVPICSSACFRLALWIGWFEPARLWAKNRNMHLSQNAERGDAKMYERKVNQAGLFPNTLRPEKSDFNAQLDVECGQCGKVTNFWVNGWRKITQSGGKYIALSLRSKAAASNSHSASPEAKDDVDRDNGF